MFFKKIGIGVYFYLFLRLFNMYIDLIGNLIVFDIRKEDIRKNYSDVEKKVFLVYKVEIWKDLFLKLNEYLEKMWGYLWMILIDDFNIKIINDKIWNYIFLIILKVVMVKEKDFDKVWNEFLVGFEKFGNSKVEEYYIKRIK